MDETLMKRVLPHSIEAEQSVIGSMLMDREAVIAASEIIVGSDFYQHQYGVMFDAMVELFNEGKPVDLVTLQDRLKEKDVPPEVSSLDFVRDIVTMVPTSANVRSYAQIVHEKAVLRKLIRTTEEIANTCYAGKDPLEDILADTEKQIFNLLQSRSTQDFVPIKQVAINVLEKIEEAYKTQGTVTGVPTGFIDLDYKLSGFQPSDLVLIAARPSMGKTAFVLNVVDHVAVRKKLPCMVFSLEMSKEQLVNRMLSMESNVDAQKLRTGSLTDSDWDAVVEGVGIIGNAKLVIDDTPGISISELRSKCRKMKLEHGLSIVIIDYLQLMSGSGKGGNDNRQQEISEISRSLKALAREMHAPVVALSQLSRACETRTDHRPMLSDLRESGAIEQVFSLEMSKEQLVNRMLSMESNVDAQKLRTGSLTDSDWDAVVEGVGIIGNAKLVIDDTPGISISELRSKCRKMKLEHGLSIVIIDYLQLMSGSGKGGNDNRQQEISEISRSLKALAREMHAPVVALSQLSRACETRTDHRPMLSDLRESGAIEQDADVVMFLYRDDYYNKDTEHPNEAEVIIAKQRNGPIGTVTLIWKPEYTKFVNATRPQGEGAGE